MVRKPGLRNSTPIEIRRLMTAFLRKRSRMLQSAKLTSPLLALRANVSR